MSHDPSEKPERSPDAAALGLEVRKLAHDLNNTLMPILLAVETLRRKVPDKSLEATIAKIERSARRAADLADQILRLGRG